MSKEKFYGREGWERLAEILKHQGVIFGFDVDMILANSRTPITEQVWKDFGIIISPEQLAASYFAVRDVLVEQASLSEEQAFAYFKAN